MTELSVSPFKLIRWENEDSRHFYFLDTSDYQKIREARKHCFVIGHRGTGKTSLLKALNWRERVSNPALDGSSGQSAFDDGVVGCYFGLQYLQMDVLNDWLRDASVSVTHAILSSYLRGLWIEEACKAVTALRTRAGMESLSEEVRVLEEIEEEFDQWLPASIRSSLSSPRGVLSLRRIRDVAARLTDEIYSRATDMFSSPEEVAGLLRLGRLVDFSNHVFEALARLLPTHHGAPWVFQMCIDEGEYLSDAGRGTVRTMVRECRSPLLMTVASLDDLGVETINPQVRLTVHDRLLLDLRRRSVRQFIDLINGIMNERLRSIDDSAPKFDVAVLLGSFTLDELLLVARPERPESRRQIAVWTEEAKDSSASRSAPIRAFLSAGGGISEVEDPLTSGDELESSGGDRVQRRASESSGYRKKFVAGYLKLLATLGVREPVYAGTNIALRMMENSLRDVFIFLDSCFEIAQPLRGSPLPERITKFVARSPVSVSHQNSALKRLSTEKMADLDGRLVNLTSVSRALVEFLSQLSSKLDMDPSSRPISIPERTLFSLEIPQAAGDLDLRREDTARTVALLEAIHNCSREGYLVGGIDPTHPNRLQVRVNRSLAKLHGFSYRQPQYMSRIRWEHLDRIAITGGDLDLEALASRAYTEIVSSGGRPIGSQRAKAETHLAIPLFDMEQGLF
ncbi:hypothetical protein E3T34_01045 [Cryobacterium sp. TMT1-62]|uniref:ORC-CDC6 family AAA ATPase n=1 Tax=Cryobacterium sp. TMT1-62 TaxID=1259240 RepID=UPI00106A6002|nr:hypothetical protein [Cryobacterium sp. TMT1-62]TFD36289.1 hypothetical protein E3T34_01045 [Cryobacterium sp. TMT1-62]